MGRKLTERPVLTSGGAVPWRARSLSDVACGFYAHLLSGPASAKLGERNRDREGYVGQAPIPPGVAALLPREQAPPCDRFGFQTGGR